VILTLDLGTTRTKAVVWGDAGAVAGGDATIATRHPEPSHAEQDPDDWWRSVVLACATARAANPDAWAEVEAVGFSAARQTIVPATSAGIALGPAIVWSDRRASAEAAVLGALPGTAIDGGSVAAKLAWLRAHEPERLAACRWVVAPRDLVVWRLTGRAVTDPTLASATGLTDDDVAALLPPVVASDTIVGVVAPGPAGELGLGAAVEVVVGAGDRQCEVLATDASARRPMVSWGTTANVSIPTATRPDPVPTGLILTSGALGGWLIEGGLAAAGSLLAWLGGLTGVDVDGLAAGAASSPPGARGARCIPWLGGARAPWWRDGVGAGFLGLGPSHGAGDLARAAFEAVAWEIVRCIEASGARPEALALAGGSAIPAWVTIVTAVTGVPGVRRASADAASAGAALITAGATGRALTLAAVNPVADLVTPPPGIVATYRRLRPSSDAALAAGLSAAGFTGCGCRRRAVARGGRPDQ
jgi:xylulokinase